MGYLLVCKKQATSGLTELFERLNEKCKDNYKYECWNGGQFLSKLIMNEKLQKIYFPKYYEYIQTIKLKAQ